MSALDFRRSRLIKGHGLFVHISLGERLRAARGVPQAVVKVISYGHGAKGVGQSIDYISRKGELAIETERGDLIQGRQERKELVRNWSRDFGSRKNSRDSVHIAFSMPKGSDPEALRGAVRTVLTKNFSDHEAVFAIHLDRPHPHAHVVVKMRSRETGKQLRLNEPELYKLREAFAEAAREQGVELAASPRAARGVGQKGMRQVIYQLHQKKIIPRVEKEAVREILEEMERGGFQEKIWERAMRERNNKERKAYLADAQSLRVAAAQEDARHQEAFLAAARDMERFAKTMPKAQTRRQAFIERISKTFGPGKTKNDRSHDNDMELD